MRSKKLDLLYSSNKLAEVSACCRKILQGVPKKVDKFEIKNLCSENYRSVDFVSFIRQVFNLDFGT